MARLLITGVSGLLGSNLALSAAPEHTVVGMYHSHKIALPGCGVRACDLTEDDTVRRCLDDIQPEAIIHCAALTDVDLCEDDPESAQRVNVDATMVLADWAREHGAGFVYVSTDAVFDGQRGHYSEDDTPRPVNRYARTKLEGEEVVRGRLPGALIVRTNLYGWSVQDRLSFGEWVLRGLVRREPLTMFTDVVFNPLVATDLARVILDLLRDNAEGTYHVGAADACSKHTFALRLAECFGMGADSVTPISVDGHGFRAPRPKDISLDVGRVTRLLGRDMPSISQGLSRFKSTLSDGHVTRLKGQRPSWTAALEGA